MLKPSLQHRKSTQLSSEAGPRGPGNPLVLGHLAAKARYRDLICKLIAVC